MIVVGKVRLKNFIDKIKRINGLEKLEVLASIQLPYISFRGIEQHALFEFFHHIICISTRNCRPCSSLHLTLIKQKRLMVKSLVSFSGWLAKNATAFVIGIAVFTFFFPTLQGLMPGLSVTCLAVIVGGVISRSRSCLALSVALGTASPVRFWPDSICVGTCAIRQQLRPLRLSGQLWSPSP